MEKKGWYPMVGLRCKSSNAAGDDRCLANAAVYGTARFLLLLLRRLAASLRTVDCVAEQRKEKRRK